MVNVQSARQSATRARGGPSARLAGRRFGADKPLKLDAGVELSPFQIAYKTYGTLNADKSNAVLVCHALTGDQHVASLHPVTGKTGWWETMVGPGKPIDTDALFRHLLRTCVGGCMGTTRAGLDQSEDRQAVGARISRSSPSATWCARRRCCSIISASTRCSRWPAARWAACRCCNGRRAIRERVFAALPIACATRHSAQNIAFHEVGRQAVMADPEWRGGRYHLRRQQSAARPRGRAHGRAHHLSVGRRAAPQIRPQVPGPRESDVFVRCRFRGGILSAPSGHHRSSSASTPIRISI